MFLKKIILFFIFVPFFIKAQGVSWFLSDQVTSHKWAVVPSYKRTQTLGHVLGGRVFIYPSEEKGLYLSLSSEWKPQQNQILSLKFNTIYWFQNDHEFTFVGEVGDFFNSFYKIASPDRIEIPVRKWNFQSSYFIDVFNSFLAGPSVELRYRKEMGQPCFFVPSEKEKIKLKDSCRWVGNPELGISVGTIFKSDTRNQMFNPTTGVFRQAQLKLGHDFMRPSSLFFQMQIQNQHVFSIFNNEIFVINLDAGISFLDRSTSVPYSYQFKLGGADHLRGYQEARFYSDQYYLAQIEIRWPLTQYLYPLIFFDVGNVEFNQKPKTTFGTGLRVGLPPHYDKQIRVEFGLASDQQNFVIAFARPY